MSSLHLQDNGPFGENNKYVLGSQCVTGQFNLFSKSREEFNLERSESLIHNLDQF